MDAVRDFECDVEFRQRFLGRRTERGEVRELAAQC
jgi:hypothetical protein